jgi:dTDP-4-dehydro-6-deoxy-alpha-D-glucopyranose 2,3-dehydratase
MASAISASGPLRLRQDQRLSERVTLSTFTLDGAQLSLDDFDAWLARRKAEHPYRVDLIPFAELRGWRTDPTTGNLVHETGRFFSVEGLNVQVHSEPRTAWQQPIIYQPEIGILGILVKEFGGVMHCLMQAKMEPGNPNLLQLAPTVQATKSNYTRVHRGASVNYLEYFERPQRDRVLADVLQSEHGAWFHRKHNRNMIVETDDDVPVREGFCWLTLGQLAELLKRDNLVNMDARTVLSCLPRPLHPETFRALHSDAGLRYWLTSERSRYDVHAERVPLAGIRDWERTETEIRHVDEHFFDVVAVSVEAASREVVSWTQPLFRPAGTGIAAFLLNRIDGVPHLLAHARVEGGLRDSVEIAPTVQRIPSNYTDVPAGERPPYLDLVLDADPSRVHYEAVHSEEGGRFLDAVSRYLIVETPPSMSLHDVPPGYFWVTPEQLFLLIEQGHCVNVQARTLVACLGAAEVENHA